MIKDPYVYPNTEVLKNKFNEKDDGRLNNLEADFTVVRLKEIMDNKKVFNNFDFKDLCDLHQHVFQDIYEWAGQPRTINIEKPEPALMGHSVEYADCKEIKSNAEPILLEMKSMQWDKFSTDDKAKQFCKSMSGLWKTHPFREGNTRTIVTFCSKYAESRGIILDTALFEKHSAYLRTALVADNAILKDIGDKRQPQHLLKIVKDSMQRGIKKELNVLGETDNFNKNKGKEREKGGRDI